MIGLKVLLHLFHIHQNTQELEDLQIISLIQKLLIRINPKMFQGIKNFDFVKMSKQQVFLEIISLVGNYLNFIEFKRLNKDFQKNILDKLELNKLLGLVIYISINSLIKNEVIGIILSFNQDQQKNIMNIVQQMDSQCEDLLQLRKVIDKIGIMEQENDVLRQKIREKLGQSEKQNSKLKQLQNQNVFLLKQIKNYKNQKNTVLNHFKLNNISEYIYICNDIRHKNVILENNIQEIQNYRIALVASNLSIKQEIKKNGKTIQNQIQSIQSLKKMCKQLNFDKFVQCEKDYDKEIKLPLLPLEENHNIRNIKKGMNSDRLKLETDRTACSTKRQTLQQECQQKHNLQILINLKKLQLEQKKKHQLILILKRDYKLELMKERKIKEKIRRLKKQHQQYNKIYESIK